MNQPIVVDKDGVIIVGHGRYEACKLLGIEPEIKVIDIPKKKANAYRLADNKLNESDWDMELVIEELKDLDDLDLVDLTGFDKDLLIEQNEKDDEVPELPDEPTSKLGDIYQLGNHRILCGDSTKIEDVEKLMDGKKAQMCFTDPPYNVDYTGGVGTHEKNKREGILNDKMSKGDFFEFLSNVSSRIVENVRGGYTYA